MEAKEIMVAKLEAERDYSKREALQQVAMLRGVLDRLEVKIENNTAKAHDSFQGNEWKLYKELSNLERYNGFIEELKK